MSCTGTTTPSLPLHLQFVYRFQLQKKRDSNTVRKWRQEIEAVKNNELEKVDG